MTNHQIINSDVVIIGAGPAGIIAAAYLNKQGLDVLVLEKQIFPRFVIGESLLPHVMDQLEEVDLLEVVKSEGFQIKKGAVFHYKDKSCDFSFSNQFTKGWDWTWQVDRASFDKCLTDELQKRGVDILFGSEVIHADCSFKKQTITYKDATENSHHIITKYIIDASGYGRVLPKLFDLNHPSNIPAKGAIFAHFKETTRSKQTESLISVHSIDQEAWIWEIPLAKQTTSIGLVAEKRQIQTLSEDGCHAFKELVYSHPAFKQQYRKENLLFEPKSIIAYSIGVKKMYGEGYVLCGNSTEFIDPVFSSGVLLATKSGLLAATLVEKQLSGQAVDWEKDYEQEIQKGIGVFRSYIKAWYDGTLHTIFFADKIEVSIKDKICSVLAGYAWDESNPFVKKHHSILDTLAKVIAIRN